MSGLYRFDTIIQSTTNLPRDQIINSWHFYKEDSFTDDFENVRDMLRDFFTVGSSINGSNTVAVKMWIPESITQNTVLVRAYKVGATPGSPPDWSGSFNFGARGSATPLPAEVALCLSFQSEHEDGVPQARRRNRKYLGPFGSNANSTEGRPSSAVINSIVAAARDLKQASAASLYWKWVVYSPTSDTYEEVDDGWVDNAWDTQRRRGRASTARTTWTQSSPPD